MDIRDLLGEIAATYEQHLGTGGGVHAQDLLREVSSLVRQAVPGGFEAKGYGGQGTAAHTPWIGVFHPDITRDPKEGLYLAYIFAADLKSVTLTLQQGVTRLADEYGDGQKLRDFLSARGATLFSGLPSELVADWANSPSFNSTVDRPRAYEAGSVVSRCYEIGSLPPEGVLRQDLWHAAEILRLAARVEPGVSVEPAPEGFTAGYVPTKHTEYKGLEGFQPKDGTDYVAHIAERTITKSRSHEVLVEQFGHYIEERGFVPITKEQHPRDLVLRRDGAEWLVEAKTISGHNPTSAVRGAVGQLLEYSHFWYQPSSKPHLLALFSEDIEGYMPYLEELKIASVWRTPGGWTGSPLAAAWGLVD
ncbi:MrcB family domain-containing protein [Streptomyces sp. NPDC000405]|uniref:MrcB family domain-containing protein n=1 Tax=Streptomyces sp. NPDC000405 TaxID=3161033 RepID=UPI00398CD744